MMASVLWLVMDERAWDNPDDALIYVACTSKKEAKKDKREMFPNGVIVKLERTNNGDVYEVIP